MLLNIGFGKLSLTEPTSRTESDMQPGMSGTVFSGGGLTLERAAGSERRRVLACGQCSSHLFIQPFDPDVLKRNSRVWKRSRIRNGCRSRWLHCREEKRRSEPVGSAVITFSPAAASSELWCHEGDFSFLWRQWEQNIPMILMIRSRKSCSCCWSWKHLTFSVPRDSSWTLNFWIWLRRANSG